MDTSIGETAYDKHYSCSESQYTHNKSTYKSICKELLKHVNINQKIMNPKTKLSDLTVEDLISIIKLKSTQ